MQRIVLPQSVFWFPTSVAASAAVLPSPRFSCAIGLVLDLFRGEKIAVAVFWATIYAHAAIFGLVSKVVVLRHVLQ